MRCFQLGALNSLLLSKAQKLEYFNTPVRHSVWILKTWKKMKRRASFQSRSQHLNININKCKRNLILLVFLFICVGTFLLLATIHSNSNTNTNTNTNTNIMSYPQKPKIAFLFIARNRLPLDFVWDAFFREDKDQRFSVYVHSRPGFLFNKATTKSPYFLNRQVNNSVQVDWGSASMIQAERILLENALGDFANERFVFVSDSCVPLYNFSYTYKYIMATSTSFVDSFSDTKEGRYNPKMHPIVPVNNWRKGSQWAVLNRKHAEFVIKDEMVFPVFQQYCRRKSLPEFWRDQPFSGDNSKEHNCIPDEHYVQTLLAQEGLEGEITRRSLTHTAWDIPSSKEHERRGWHPVTYKFSDATPELIRSIKEIDNIYYETEDRREWCSSKGKPSSCFLFARKFTRPAAIRLLNLTLLGT